ncbi:Hypothetical predicted protein [Podarcis lilfordi]|uniref:Uncharacterized protein n=1 Tax=Podarcis lilfordi TaxID=74358 RepID=A0AA35PS67_9SAUR|nr:Hypothetical predicted protein [Podarcis lilfordi]
MAAETPVPALPHSGALPSQLVVAEPESSLVPQVCQAWLEAAVEQFVQKELAAAAGRPGGNIPAETLWRQDWPPRGIADPKSPGPLSSSAHAPRSLPDASPLLPLLPLPVGVPGDVILS